MDFEHALREFGEIRIDTTGWPILLMEFPEKRVTDAAFQEALAYIEALLPRAPGKSFQITDLTRVRELAPATQRKFASDWMDRTAVLHQTFSVGGANVTPSSIVRGIVTAIHWLKPPPTPTRFCATRAEAMQIAVRALDAAGVVLPPRLVELRDKLDRTVR